MKYKFLSDDDGHWFIVPLDMVELFNKMLEEGEEDYWCEFNNTFGKYWADHPSSYTFENYEQGE